MSGLDKAFGVSPQVLALRTQKLNLLSANIANAATPDYKATSNILTSTAPPLVHR